MDQQLLTAPEELRADLRDALNFALGENPSEADTILADLAISELQSYDDGYRALELLLTTLGAEVFGAVLLHAIEQESSLRGFAESSLHHRNLSALGITMRDLDWPEDALQWPWKDEPLVEESLELLPAVDFLGAEAKAVELGYDEPSQRALVEHHLVEYRFHSPQVSAVRANMDGIKGAHWEAIIRTFTGEEKTNG